MTGGALFHKLSKDTGLEGLMPFLVHGGKDFFADGFSGPVGDDFLFVNISYLVTYIKRGFVAGGQNSQVFETVAAQFRVGWGGFGGPRSPTICSPSFRQMFLFSIR